MKYLIFFILLIPSLAFGYGSPDYLPDGAHPRIYLTPTVIAEYNSLQDAGAAVWTTLETWCDTHLNDAGYDTGSPKWDDDLGYNGYRMSGYSEYLIGFSLAYQVLKDDDPTKAATYATYVRNILIDGIAASFSVGDEANNGLQALRGGEVGDDTSINENECFALDLTRYNEKIDDSELTLNAAGTGFLVGDTVTLEGGNSWDLATVSVDSVGTSGEILTFTITNDGSGYAVTPATLTTTAINGSGATFDFVDELVSTCYDYKLGYPGRNLRSVPIAYDWIYDTLSADDKAIIENMLLRWFDWIRGVRSTYNDGVLVGTTRYYEDTDGDCTGDNDCTVQSTTSQKGYAFDIVGNNFFAGESVLMIDTIMALYGENADATALLSYVDTDIVQEKMLDIYGSDLRLSGGDSSEGNTYYGGYEFSIRALYAYYTATGRDIFSTLDWDEELLKNNISRVFPDLITVPVWGDANNTGERTNRAYVLVPFSGINTQINPTLPITGVGKWMVDNYGYSRPVAQDQMMLWAYKDPTATVESPDDAGIPVFHRATGTGLVTMRSSWVNADDSVFGAIRIEAKREAAHENYDEGGFYVARGDDALIDRITYDDRVIMSSTIDFSELGHNSPEADSLTETAIDRMSNGDDYTYTSGVLTTDTSGILYEAWHDNKADYFRRSFLFIRPNIFIVYDITKSNANQTNQKDWYVQFYGEPTVTGDVTNYINGTSQVYSEMLYPTDGVLTKNSNSSSYTPNIWWNTKYTVDTNQYDQFLNIIEATGSTDSQTTTSLVSGTNTRGALVGTTVAMFTTDQDGADLTSASYTVDATTHYVADLPVNTLINVSRAGASIVVDQDSGDAGIIEFAATSGSAEYIVTAGDAVAPEPDPDPDPGGTPLGGNSRFNLGGTGGYIKIGN